MAKDKQLRKRPAKFFQAVKPATKGDGDPIWLSRELIWPCNSSDYCCVKWERMRAVGVFAEQMITPNMVCARYEYESCTADVWWSDVDLGNDYNNRFDVPLKHGFYDELKDTVLYPAYSNGQVPEAWHHCRYDEDDKKCNCDRIISRRVRCDLEGKRHEIFSILFVSFRHIYEGEELVVYQRCKPRNKKARVVIDLTD